MPSRTSSIRCHCNGQLRPTELLNFDFSAFVGVPVTLQKVPGYQCQKCGEASLSGSMVNLVEKVLVLAIAKKPSRLAAQETKYLRRYLGLTQEKLADRMAIDRVTIARWETGEVDISPQHDFILRGMMLASLRPGGAHAKPATPPKVLDDAISSLTSVRRDPPTPGAVLDPAVVQSVLDKLRPGSRQHDRL